jgi:hypothetical protein
MQTQSKIGFVRRHCPIVFITSNNPGTSHEQILFGTVALNGDMDSTPVYSHVCAKSGRQLTALLFHARGVA